jgi:photosystem II stability/assembly factor-like uncharacterized protein
MISAFAYHARKDQGEKTMNRRLQRPRALFTMLFCLLLAAAAWAAPGGNQANPADKLKNLEFRELGPAVMGGRVDDFAVVESNPNIVYAGLASGGVWKTTNSGTTWEPVFDKEEVSTIGDVAVAPSDPSIVWAGTGEPNNRQSSSWGDGVYKSLDGGKTWQKMGLEATHHIGRIVIHPKNPDVVYVAALGQLWGPNAERGVYKTTDGGKTWAQVLKINEDTGVSDIALDPESPETLYAAAYQRRRTVYGFNGGGTSGAIYKTSDGGASWKKLTKGLPYENGGEVGRIGLDIYRKNSNIVYALVQHEKGGVFRSEDKGETWKKMGDTDPRPSYYSQIRIDPTNDLRLWVLGANMYYSEDGGKTFTTQRVKSIHGDFHAMWIDPADANHMITGSDGGIHWSYDAGKSWDFVNTIAIGQFYEVGYDLQKPYHICGGLQDNGVWCGPSNSLTREGIINADWMVLPSGDGFYAQPDPVDPSTVYYESQDGELSRFDLRTMQHRKVMPEAEEGEAHYRFQWNSPVAISAHDHNTIYYGGNFFFKSTDRGDSWTRLGGDLTTGVERNKLPILGKVPDKETLSRHDGVEHYPCITTISESPLTANVLWAGTDDGNLQVSRDAGKSWKNVAGKVPGLPKGTYVSRVLASKYAEGTAYAAFDGHRGNDYSVYLFMTTDYGESWKAIRTGIPNSAGSVHVVREHPRNQNLLFAGTEFGLWVSWDRGGNWTALKNNLPTVPVDDIAIQPQENDLILGTHGRSIWIFDDLTPIEKLNAEVLASDLTFFEVRPATSFRHRQRRWSAGQKMFTAKNPLYGAVLNYYLKEAVAPEPAKPGADDKDKAAAAAKKEGKVKITVLDKDGKVVREMEGPGTAGVNRTNWDLRWNATTEPRPEELEAIAGGWSAGPRGPLVEPGEYTVKIKAGAKEAAQKVVVEEDPRVQITAAERAARREAISKLYEIAKIAGKDRQTISGLKDALTAAREQWKKEGAKAGGLKIPEEIQKAAEELQKKVDAVAEKYLRPREALGSAGPPLEWKPAPLPNRVQELLAELDSYTAAPGGQQKEKMAELAPLVTEASAQVKKLAEEDLPALNKKMNEAGIPHIVPAAGAQPAPGGDEEESER